VNTLIASIEMLDLFVSSY